MGYKAGVSGRKEGVWKIQDDEDIDVLRRPDWYKTIDLIFSSKFHFKHEFRRPKSNFSDTNAILSHDFEQNQ